MFLIVIGKQKNIRKGGLSAFNGAVGTQIFPYDNSAQIYLFSFYTMTGIFGGANFAHSQNMMIFCLLTIS